MSRKMVHAMAASIGSPIATRTLTAVDPRTAIRGHVRQLHMLSMSLIPMMLFRQRRPEKKKGARGRRNLLKRLNSRKERAWILLPLAWIFLPKGLDFPSLRLGFSLPRFAQKENSAAPQNSMNNNVNSTSVNAVGRQRGFNAPSSHSEEQRASANERWGQAVYRRLPLRRVAL